MPVITTSRLKKLLCQTLIREKLSYKIIFQNTTFLFSPLKLKVYNSIHRTVRYASSLACSFNQIIWGIKWFSPGLLKLKKLE
jgi:hypothetical protein